ncbi:hypothetical protein K435DRAFT_590706, partial [Dendrothele bispora CBS 962.96]
VPMPVQKSVQLMDAVMDSYQNNSGHTFFLQNAGHCGTSWVSNTIASAICAKEDVVFTVKYSGIAALLLQGEQTAHSRFKLPIPILEDSVCPISENSKLHKVIAKTKLII